MMTIASGLRHSFWIVVLACASASIASAQQWIPQGPAPNTLGQVENIANREVAGAVNAVAPHPTDANIVYIAAVNGGVWKTVNAMAASPTWQRQTDFQASLTMGAIEFDPTDATSQTLLAGGGRSSSFGDGGALIGLLRTTNGGATWAAITGGGVLNGANIFGVAPRGATMVIATTNRGVLRSTDSGATWTTISGAAGTGLPAGGAFDLASDPNNQARLYANAGTNGIFRSTDTGATWTSVSSAAMNTMMAGGLSNIDIAVGRNNNVYVAIVTGGRLAGIFRSGDGGTTWTAMDLPTTAEGGIHPGGQGSIHLSLAADPTTDTIVYVGGDRQPSPFPNTIGANDFSGRLFRGDSSQPAGSQFVHLTHSTALGPAGGGTASSSSPHADSRDMDVAANGVLIEVDDGGIYRRTNPRNNTGDWFSMNGNLQSAEFHSVAWDSRSHIVIGGAQDTGTPEQIATGLPTFRSVSTADGGVVTVDDLTTPGFSTRYSSNQFLGGFRRQVFNAANVFISSVAPARTPLGGSPAMTAQFYTPIKVNTITPTRLIFGAANGVYESLDQGDTVRALAPVITANGTGPHTIAYGAAGNPDMLYVGSGSRVFVRTAPPPAAMTQSATYPGGFVLGIAIDPATPAVAYVVDSNAVFRTTDSGATWTTLTGNLPSLNPGPLRSVAFTTVTADGAVVVGADRGVFMARGCGNFSAWQRLGTGLPTVPVFELEFDAADRVLLAGTLGRGAWTFTFGGAVGTPQIQIPGTVAFGDACVGSGRQATLNICNTGNANLVIDPISSSNPRFTVTTPSAGYPVVISPDFCFPFQVAFNANVAGPATSKLSFGTNDPVAACTTTDLFANGATTDVRVTGSTDFGVASSWNANEKIVRVCNVGACNLAVSSVSIAGADFSPVSNPFPATVSPDSCLDFTVGFTPILPGRRTGDLTVASDDPDTPSVVRQLTGRSPSYFSIHAGASLPHGALNTVADAGSTVNLAFTYPFRPNWAWDVRVGVSEFAGATLFPDVNVWSVLGNIKYTFNPSAAVRVFVNGGAGLYQFDPGDAEFGFNVGGGVQIPLNRRFAVEGTYNYNHALTASPSRRFSQIQGGVLIYF